MNKVILFYLSLFLLTNTSVSAQNDAKAKTILESVSKKINALQSLKANFALYLTSANGKNNQSKKGSFFLKGQKYCVVLQDQQIICDGKTVWTYVIAANEVQVSNFDPNEQTLSPAKLFTNFYDKEYKYRYIGQKKVGGKNCEMIELIPVNNSKQFSKVELAVQANTIVGGNVFEKNGNQYRYEISGFTPNAVIADAQFVFDNKKYPGVEVVDLR